MYFVNRHLAGVWYFSTVNFLKDLADFSKSVFNWKSIFSVSYCILKFFFPILVLLYKVAGTVVLSSPRIWCLINLNIVTVSSLAFPSLFQQSSSLLDCFLLDALLLPNCRALSSPCLHGLGSVHNLQTLPDKHFAEKAGDFFSFLPLPSL